MTRTRVGNEKDFPAGELKSVQLNGKVVLIASVDGRFYSMDGKCSHMGFDLSRSKLEGCVVTCRLHGAQFDIRTGEVLRNTCAKRMSTYPVTVENEDVFIDI